MLETDEVDVDLFTPAPGTSLANIFNATQVEQDKDNTSLKYVPQTPIQPQKDAKTDESKTKPGTDCIFASAISGYDWINGTYNLRENLGFAVIKSTNENNHHLIIYTSEKNTLSVATVTSTLIITVKKDVSISYYDNFKKYWLICASSAKIANIVECLENLNVSIKYSTDDNAEEVMDDQNHKGSDVDLPNKKKNKDSILKRMATMGQSVLPSKNTVTAVSTDSAEENDNENSNNKPPRHKHLKSVSKRSSVERHILPKADDHLQSNKPLPTARSFIENSTIILPLKQELALINHKDMNKTSHMQCTELNANDMNNFMSEQRISNTELRINVNRLSDKLDHLLRDQGNSSFNQPTGIVDKLIKEYERKIQSYENFLKLKGFDCDLLNTNYNGNISKFEENEEMHNMVIVCQEKDKEIEELKNKLEMLSEFQSSAVEKNKIDEISVLNEIMQLRKEIDDKNKLINKIDSNIQILMSDNSKSDMSNKIKKLMNDTYQTISMNFNDDTNYSGAEVKSIVGKIIKKSTLESLNDIK